VASLRGIIGPQKGAARNFQRRTALAAKTELSFCQKRCHGQSSSSSIFTLKNWLRNTGNSFPVGGACAVHPLGFPCSAFPPFYVTVRITLLRPVFHSLASFVYIVRLFGLLGVFSYFRAGIYK